MILYKITIGDENSCFEFSAFHKNINRMFSPEDASIIHELINCMMPNCGAVEQRVNGLDYYVERVQVSNRPLNELSAFI
jgi:hypothetical protein